MPESTESESSTFIQRDYVYDVFGRVTSMVYTKNGSADQILESYAYTYDKNNNIVSETHRSNLSGAAIYKNKAYTYDAYGRLTKSVTTDYNNSNAVSTVTCGYDAVGNRTSMTEGGITTTYTYNGLNQLTKKTEGTAETTYLYDARGNQIQEKSPDATINFTYGVTGEMLTVANGSSVIQKNEYNHEGIRISRTEGSTERQYLYDNGSVAYTLDNNALSGANILGGYQNVIGTFRGTDYYVYNKDVQGSTESITDSSFNAKAAYEYADFGEVSELTETIDNEICYTGSIHDETTGLHYMNARYYDPANGRFISQDSYRGELNDPGQWHLYVYCANNPINYVDPSGHWVLSIGVKAEAAYVFGGYVMIMGNYDGKHLLVTYSLGAKFMTNATADVGVSFAAYTYKSVDKLLGWGATLGFNLAGTVSGSVTFDKNGNVGGVFGASYAFLKTPKLAPFYFDFEFGYTNKIKKYKWSAIPKTKKYHKKYGLKIYVQRKGNYVKIGSSKTKLHGKIYKNGRVSIGR